MTETHLILMSGTIAAAFVALASGWVWLLLGVLRDGPRRVAGRWAIQLSLAAVVTGLLLQSPSLMGFGALFPPVALFTLFVHSYPAGFVVLLIPWIVLATTAAVLLARRSATLRPWTPIIGFLVALNATVVSGEVTSRQAMCSTAADLGVTEFPRNTLLWSMANAPAEFQLGLHAELTVEGQRYGWSYSEMDWYPLPSSVGGATEGGIHICWR